MRLRTLLASLALGLVIVAAAPHAGLAALYNCNFSANAPNTSTIGGTFDVNGSNIIVGITGATSDWGPITALLAPNS